MEKIVLFDNPRNGWSHLVASDLETLHAFAEKIGLKKHWFQNKRKKGKKQPHYDIKPNMFDTAIAHGAKRVTRGELLTFLEDTYY